MAQHFLPAPALAGTRQYRIGKVSIDKRISMRSSRLVLGGAIAVIGLAVIFLLGTIQAISMIDEKSVDSEVQRATIAVDLVQQSGASVDSVMAQKIGHDYVLGDTRLAPPADLGAAEVFVPVAGTSLVLAWTPHKLGSETANIVAPVRITAAVLVLSGVLLILYRLYRLACDLDSRRRVARDLASRDSLTGLLNRRGFMEKLEAGFAEGGAQALLYLDLDDFKQVNDRYGHAAGDQLLQCVAQRLTHIVGPADAVARLGGDEFVVIRASATSPAELAEFASLIHSRVTLPYGLGDVEARVGLSIGIARRTAPMHHAEDLLASADAALYRAKDVEAVAFTFAEELVEGLPKAA